MDKPTKGDDFPVTGGVPLPESMVHKPTKLSKKQLAYIQDYRDCPKCWNPDMSDRLLGELLATLSAKDAELERQAAKIRSLEARICDLSGALSPFANWWRLYLIQQDTGSLGQPSDMRRAYRVIYQGVKE